MIEHFRRYFQALVLDFCLACLFTRPSSLLRETILELLIYDRLQTSRRRLLP